MSLASSTEECKKLLLLYTCSTYVSSFFEGLMFLATLDPDIVLLLSNWIFTAAATTTAGCGGWVPPTGSACVPTDVSTCRRDYLPTSLPIDEPTYRRVYLPTSLPIDESTYRRAHVPTYLPIDESIYQRVYLPTYLPTDESTD